MDAEKFDPYKPPTATLVSQNGYSRTKRILVSALCVLTSGIGILSSVVLIVGSFAELFAGEFRAKEVLMALASICLIFAWASYFVMIWGWVMNKETDERWPIFGTIVGAAIALFVNVLSFSVLPSIVLATYLVHFHLTNGSRRSLRSLGTG